MKKIHSLVQGTTEWNQHRCMHFNASDAAAMLGISKYTSRSELLRQKATGFSPEVSHTQQAIFDKGHEYEAAARPWAEEIIEDDLYPVVMSIEIDGLPLSASYDGITMDEDVIFENKTLNKNLARSLDEGIIPDEYKPQMEQQLLISGAAKCLFVASNGDKEAMRHAWYTSDTSVRTRLLDGWRQLQSDLASYQPVESAPDAVAETIEGLPALLVEVEGRVLSTNLDRFRQSVLTFIGNINTDLKDDNDFATAEKTTKFCKDAEDRLDLVKAQSLAQTASIDEVFRVIDTLRDELKSKRLFLDRLVKERKETIKSSILADARLKFAEHLAAIETEIKPIRLVYQQPDFQGAIKNKRTLASLHDAVDSTLANAKIATDAIAKDVRAKLAWHKEHAVGYEMLFADLDRIIYKPADDFQMLVKNRIDQHKLDEKKKIEAEVLRVQEENKRKAELEAIKAATVQPVPVQPAPVAEAPKPTLVKIDPKQVIADRIKPTMIMLARRDLEDFRNKYSGLTELVMVMEEIDSFLMATAEPEAASA
jgi:putative phage-type endonuclease